MTGCRAAHGEGRVGGVATVARAVDDLPLAVDQFDLDNTQSMAILGLERLLRGPVVGATFMEKGVIGVLVVDDHHSPAVAFVAVAEREVVHAVVAHSELLRLLLGRVGQASECGATGQDRVAPRHDRPSGVAGRHDDVILEAERDRIEAKQWADGTTVRFDGASRPGTKRTALAAGEEGCGRKYAAAADQLSARQAALDDLRHRFRVRRVRTGVVGQIDHGSSTVGQRLAPLLELEPMTGD